MGIGSSSSRRQNKLHALANEELNLTGALRHLTEVTRT